MSTHQVAILMERLRETIDDEDAPLLERVEATELFNQCNRLLKYPTEPRRI